MIPLSNASRRLIHFPVATLTIIFLNFIVFSLELIGGDAFINHWAVIPAEIMAGRRLVTIFTAMFMHEGWMHILSNMLFLWVFGPQIESIMRPFRFIIFYLLGGIVATYAQAVFTPFSTIPNLGASGAIAAVMGAFLITYPRDRIKTVVILGWFIQVAFIPAAVLVGVWFISQLFNALGALAINLNSGGVAYMAHVGGFLFGLITARIFEKPAEVDRQFRLP